MGLDLPQPLPVLCPQGPGLSHTHQYSVSVSGIADTAGDKTHASAFGDRWAKPEGAALCIAGATSNEEAEKPSRGR